MQKKFNLKAFNLYEFLKHQNAGSAAFPFFIADNQTYKNAHVNFPFRTFVYGLGVTYSGKADSVKIGSVDYLVKPDCLTTIGPGIVCSWADNYAAEHDTVYFTEDLFRHMSNAAFLHSLDFFNHGGNHVLQLSAGQVQQLRSAFTLLKQLRSEEKVVSGIVYSMLMLAESFHEENSELNKKISSSAKDKIIAGFRKQLAEEYPEHKDVAYYAGNLNITPKYLSEVTQSEMGKSAKMIIDDFVATEAKSLLKQTDMNIQEISYWLGFEDASHFTKFFRKQTNRTPSEYRLP